MSTITSPIASTPPAAISKGGATTPPAVSDGLANEETFLKLLVSQLQNQDPLSPTDSNQFVSQLTSYSQLEQLIGIHGDTTSLDQAAAGQAAVASGSTQVPPTQLPTNTTSTTAGAN